MNRTSRRGSVLQQPASANVEQTRVFRWIRVAFLLGSVAVAAELLLLHHTEEATQILPLVILAIGIVMVPWQARRPSRALTLATKLHLLICAVSAGVGLWLHFDANQAFERELSPSLSGFALFWKAIQGTAPPSLAPGAMLQLAMLGWISTMERR